MENIETNGVESPNSEVDTQIDYKAESEKFKRLKDQYAKESADWKHKYTETLGEAEKQRIANEEREAYYKAIEREYNLSKISGSLSKNIGNEDVVKEMASKLIDGDNMAAIKALNKYLAAHDEEIEKRITERLLKDNPTPPASQTDGAKDLKYYMSTEAGMLELNKIKATNPEEYYKILNGLKK